MSTTEIERVVVEDIPGYYEHEGTDGLRGVFTEETDPRRRTLNPEMVAQLTYALVASQVEVDGRPPRLLIGSDTRGFNSVLEMEVAAGARAAGAREVTLLGVSPSPSTFKLAGTEGYDLAISLSASHNAAKFAGWKPTVNSGNMPVGSDKISSGQSQEINRRFWTQHASGLAIPREGFPYNRRPELVKQYADSVVADIREQFDDERPLTGKVLVVDTARGAANSVTPYVLKQLGAEVVPFACDTDGPINDGCGATHLEGLKNFFKQNPDIANNPDLLGAIANDGDADRMMALGVRIVDEEPVFEELEGNRVTELYASGEPGVVVTEYANPASVKRIRDDGTEVVLCDNGDIMVTRSLRERGWRRGGEFSGHHVDLDWLSSGDGIRMGAWLAAYATKVREATFYDIAKPLDLWPTLTEAVELDNASGRAVQAHQLVVDAARHVRGLLGEWGAIIQRPSGTEPVYRAQISAQEEALAQQGLTIMTRAIHEAKEQLQAT